MSGRLNKGSASNIVEPSSLVLLRCTKWRKYDRWIEPTHEHPQKGDGDAIVNLDVYFTGSNADHFEIKKVCFNVKLDERIDKLADQLSTLVEIVSKKVVTPAPVKRLRKLALLVGNNFHGNQGFQAQNNHAPNFQNQGFQNQPFQVPNNQVQQEISNDFSSYKRNNDQMLRNMQNQINSLKGDLKNEIQNTIKSQQAVMMNQQTTFQNNLQNMICGLFQNQASTSGTLPSNTIPNPKGEMKAITTRSGVAYEGPSIPTNHSPKKVVERETEETTDKEQTNFQGSTAQIPPPVIPIPEPDVPVINNVDELNEDECFDLGGVEINVEVDDSFTFVTQTFLPYLTYPE
ncbi:hypothetical protein Tco_0418792, partial [Tanacetum coccineum]